MEKKRNHSESTTTLNEREIFEHYSRHLNRYATAKKYNLTLDKIAEILFNNGVIIRQQKHSTDSGLSRYNENPLAIARNILDYYGLLIERNGIEFLNGKVATIGSIITEANKIRKKNDQDMLGKNQEWWC